jgi:hypothetical protein
MGKEAPLSTWRARAISLFPELHPQLESADSISALWIELRFRLEHHYRDNPTESPSLFRSICLYAIWCVASPSQAVQDAAAIEFYCYLPQFALRNRAVYERFTRDLYDPHAGNTDSDDGRQPGAGGREAIPCGCPAG